MRLPANVDPFNLGHLLEEIDRQCFRLITTDFHRLVDAKGFEELKKRFRDETSTLITEMLNDMSDVRRRLKRPDVLSGDETIPTIEILIGQIPTIYVPPAATGDPQTDREANIRWQARRLAWIVSTWLQIQGRFLQDLDRLSPSEGTMTLNFPDHSEQTVPILPLSSIEFVYRLWHLLRRTTLEYLQVKADLLRAAGEETPHINVSRRECGQLLAEASRAFYRGENHTHLLLDQALREVLLDALKLPNASIKIDLRGLETSTLLVLAHNAGLPLSFPLEILGNIVATMEGCRSRCDTPLPSFLFPAFRILEATVKQLLSTKVDESVPQRAMEILRENIQGDVNDLRT